MAITVMTLARIASDIYKRNEDLGRDATVSHQRLAGTFVPNNSRGFQGAIYSNESDTIVAIRGTATGGGITADARLTLRMEPKQVQDALELYRVGLGIHANEHKPGRIIVCGHSLGGYLTQAVCATFGAWGITFNAAGARSLFTGRLLGLGKASRNRHAGAAEGLYFADWHVLNITFQGDVVSARIAGKRIGKKICLSAAHGWDAYHNHLMSTVKQGIEQSDYGNLTLEEALRHRNAEAPPT